MKKILAVMLLVLIVAVPALAQANPYQTPPKVDRFALIAGAIQAVVNGSPRQTEITTNHLDLVQALVNNNMSKMTALFFALPIRSWSHLYDVKYVSFDSTTGTSRRVLVLGDYFLWSVLFDLPLGDATHPAKLDDEGSAIIPWTLD